MSNNEIKDSEEKPYDSKDNGSMERTRLPSHNYVESIEEHSGKLEFP